MSRSDLAAALDYIDRIRRERCLMSVAEIIELGDGGNVIYDPFSTLIGRDVRLGRGNTIHSCVTLLCNGEGSLCIADGNTFHSGTIIEATHGAVVIGSDNQFGEGGFTAKANRMGAIIKIGDEGRYLAGAAVYGASTLGTGSQILGPIAVDSCDLEPGQSFRAPDPDERGGLLKGSGTARDLRVPRGHVVAGIGAFHLADMKPQSHYHPKA